MVKNFKKRVGHVKRTQPFHISFSKVWSPKECLFNPIQLFIFCGNCTSSLWSKREEKSLSHCSWARLLHRTLVASRLIHPGWNTTAAQVSFRKNISKQIKLATLPGKIWKVSWTNISTESTRTCQPLSLFWLREIRHLSGLLHLRKSRPASTPPAGPPRHQANFSKNLNWN